MIITGECRGNSAAAARLYAEKYPNRNTPGRRLFLSIDRRLRETGTLRPQLAGHCGRPKVDAHDEEILDAIEETPQSSTRVVAAQLDLSHMMVWRRLKEQQLHPYHLTTVQELLDEDYPKRIGFCDWLLTENTRNANFVNHILFTDEATFNRNGITNHHNEHIWAEENPHEKKVTHHQRMFKVNVWIGIVDNNLIGPVFLPNNLNGENYLQFLQNELPEYLEEVNLRIRQNMWYLHDGAPAHYSDEVRQHLYEQYPGRWIGRGPDAPIAWSPRGPDLNPIDFSVWGFMKTDVYAVEITSEQQLRNRILEAANRYRQKPLLFQNIRFSLLKRCRLCIQENGGHFEHIIKTTHL